MGELLQVAALHVAYGGVVALRGVDLAVDQGQTVAVLGANGAGKTSLVRAITGLEKTTGGSVTIDTADVTGWRPDAIARLGVAHVADHRGLFASMTVLENLELAGLGLGRRLTPAALDRIFELFPILQERRTQAAGTMSGGQQQMLTIARALLQEPRLLILDEMSMGLAPAIVSELFGILRQLKSEGMSILLIEQFVGGALGVADRVIVLEQGTVVASGTPAEVGADDLAAAYLGGDDDNRAAPIAALGPPARVRQAVEFGLAPRQIRALQRHAADRGLDTPAVVSELVDQLLEQDATAAGDRTARITNNGNDE
ncbi:MAG: branched-chain amino acid transport system ATP-binding protein [Glaciecola sp.]|jgi:branched-chain amino acid transport system ATP-binding protein